ncbi:MAG TPA: hypothetical protein VIS99_12075, partial [Terrimicrobiaceae bacterium]
HRSTPCLANTSWCGISLTAASFGKKKKQGLLTLFLLSGENQFHFSAKPGELTLLGFKMAQFSANASKFVLSCATYWSTLGVGFFHFLAICGINNYGITV